MKKLWLGRTVLRNVTRGILALAFAGLLLGVNWSIGAPPASAETLEIHAVRTGLKIEYSVPNSPSNVAPQAPGKTWFTSPADDAVGLITLRSDPDESTLFYTIDYMRLEAGSRPYDIVYADDTVWFTMYGANKIGRIDLIGGALPDDGLIKEYLIPTADSQPAGIAVSPDGGVWFVEQKAKKLSRFDPVTETFREYPFNSLLPAQNVMPTDLVLADIVVQAGGKMKIWLTMPAYHTVLQFDVEGEQFGRAVTYNEETGVGKWPAGIAIDAKGNIWITAFGSGMVGRLATGTLTNWAWYPTPSAGSGPKDLAIQADGDNALLWFTQQNADKLARFTVAANGRLLAKVEIGQPVGSGLSGIAIGPDDHIWFAEYGRGIVSELPPPYFYAMHLPSVHIRE
jgi:virginiamycin B lyase